MYKLIDKCKLLCLITLITGTLCHAMAKQDESTEIIHSRVLLSGHRDLVVSVAFSPDGRFIVTVSSDGTKRIWDVENRTLVHHPLSGHSDVIRSAAFSPDSRFLVTTSVHNKAYVWDTNNWLLIHTLPCPTDHISSTAFSPNSRFLVTASHGGTAHVWDTNNWSLVQTLIGHTPWIKSASFSPDGKFIIITSGFKVRVWSTNTGSLIHTLTYHANSPDSAEFSPDGRFIIGRGSYDTPRIWNTHDWSLVYPISPDHTRSADLANFSPDGRLLIVVTSSDGMARVWDTRNWSLAHKIGDANAILSIAFSPDGKFIVTTPSDYSRGRTANLRRTTDSCIYHTAYIWDTNNWLPVHGLSGHTGLVNSATFSPDGKFIVTTSSDGTMRVWDDDRRVAAQAKEIAQLLCMTQKQRLGADSPLHKISDDQFLIQYITSLAKPDSFEPVEQKSWLSSCVVQ